MTISSNSSNHKVPRKGCRDIWNAYMTRGARYTLNDIPICPSTAVEIPKGLIGYDEIKNMVHTDFFVHFYLDDYKFDGERGIWRRPEQAFDRLKMYSGVITPDFSPYQDMPEPIKLYNIFRSRAFGYWLTEKGIPVINNVRWGTPETYRYCFDGIPKGSMVAIGTVGSGLKELRNRPRFEEGLNELVIRIQPSAIIVYGSAKYSFFEKIEKEGIKVVSFPSKTSLAFERRDTKCQKD